MTPPSVVLPLPYAEHGEGLGNAVSVLRNNAMAAGLDAAVPTCPGWRVRDLVVHLGVVHRWATAALNGSDAATARADADRAGAAASDHPDLLDWLDDGLVDLLNALARAPEDLDVFFFLANTPSASRGWARRQCHEATVHAVDAMAARLGRPPAAEQTWLTPRLAVDGIDELLRGFLPRRSSRLRSAEPFTLAVTARDAALTWTVRVGEEPPQVAPAGPTPPEPVPGADVTISADAVPLYLALWNRGDEVDVVTGPDHAGAWDRWREQVQVRWS